MRYLALDIATMPISGSEAWLDPVRAPGNYKDPVKIAGYILEKTEERLSMGALDWDLGRIAAIGFMDIETEVPRCVVCPSEQTEADALGDLAELLQAQRPILVGFNSLDFDWPFLLERARDLGVSLEINTDRYRSAHRDLMDLRSHRSPARRKSLRFYARKYGWDDLVKPLSGAEESTAAVEGRWDEITASVLHDVIATARLARRWLPNLTDAEGQPF